MAHYHQERNHQGKSNVLLFSQKVKLRSDDEIECHQRLGGLLRYYPPQGGLRGRRGREGRGAVVGEARHCAGSF